MIRLTHRPSQIRDLGCVAPSPVGLEQDVIRLQVTVDDPVRVQVLQTTHNSLHESMLGWETPEGGGGGIHSRSDTRFEVCVCRA